MVVPDPSFSLEDGARGSGVVNPSCRVTRSRFVLFVGFSPAAARHVAALVFGFLQAEADCIMAWAVILVVTMHNVFLKSKIQRFLRQLRSTCLCGKKVLFY